MEGKEFNVYRNSDCEVKVKAGLCEGRVKAVAMDAQRVYHWSEFNFEIDLPGKRDRSTIYRLNLIKLYRRKPELANLVMENSSEGIDSEILYSVKLFMDIDFQGDVRRDLSFVKKGKICRKEQRGIVGQQIDFVLKWLSRVGLEVGPTKGDERRKEERLGVLEGAALKPLAAIKYCILAGVGVSPSQRYVFF
ncbi:uncharacterized protein TNCV_1822651 [Trichonephila clavipes]|uniref:Uncharacterized protein n=1 Tax=Trichonephila clavipes TaxID=2585209 RepID=A0A8X6VIR6_TRICX|nr:uncharacterized protein TNCV_1822651 [Trichonephila clavipes]